MDTTPTAPCSDLVRARGVDDLLGYAGHVLGTLPEDSIVLTTLAGSTLRAVIRVDLPPETPPHTDDALTAWARAVARTCRRDTGADAVVAVGLSQQPTPPPWWPHLDDALTRTGLPALEAWWVSRGRARRWDRPESADPGVPVDPRTSAVSARLIGLGSVWGLRDADALLPPRTDAAETSWPVPDEDDLTAQERWHQAWEHVLTTDTPHRPEHAPHLGAGLLAPLWRDGLIVQAAAGPDADTLGPAAIAELLVASGPPAPDWRRLDRLWHSCRTLAATAPAPTAAAALAVASWVAWARGQGRAAGVHADGALRLDPQHRLAQLMRAVTDAGLVADWAADPATAWRADGPDADGPLP
ncbi:DUF4192 family protein [Micrococcus sp.]|uniref:DUF4192 family protein n=1 Tax=Micrococcus sp. TaxID=1271 RepID=UPI002A911C9D|nr:DUF4192 family protein [Micrococcus sp.]MDY6055530.1 DUF4192 family protein [Micrococcus sp.]